MVNQIQEDQRKPLKAEGIRSYYLQKIEESEVMTREKTMNLRRLEAQRNELNAKGSFENKVSKIVRLYGSVWTDIHYGTCIQGQGRFDDMNRIFKIILRCVILSIWQGTLAVFKNAFECT